MEPLRPLNVFWIDDQHEEQAMLSFKVQAEQYGIILHPYASAEEGLPMLEERLHLYDAVLFDALFFERKDQVSGTEEVDGLSTAIAKVNQLKHRKAFTPFILTGQPRLDGDKTFKATFGVFYRKGDPKDVQRLFKDIRAAAEAMTDTQIRHRHQRVFDVCTPEYIGQTAGRELLGILRRENDDTFIEDAATHINSIRKIMEDLFRACHRVGLLPDTFVHGTIALNETGRFLSGIPERAYQVQNGIVPKMVGELIENILSVAQPASHRLHVDEHMARVRSPYLLYSTTYMLLDVLLWFKNFADERGAGTAVGPFFVKQEQANGAALLAEGPIERDAFGNYHCGQYSITPIQLNGRYKLGDVIAITIAENNTSTRNMHLYPKFAKRFRKA